MLPASTVPQSGQVLVSHHCRVSPMTYSLHLNRMIRQMVSRGLVYPLRVSRLTYTAPDNVAQALRDGTPDGPHGPGDVPSRCLLVQQPLASHLFNDGHQK